VPASVWIHAANFKDLRRCQLWINI